MLITTHQGISTYCTLHFVIELLRAYTVRACSHWTGYCHLCMCPQVTARDAVMAILLYEESLVDRFGMHRLLHLRQVHSCMQYMQCAVNAVTDLVYCVTVALTISATPIVCCSCSVHRLLCAKHLALPSL